MKAILFSGCFAFTGALSFAILFQIQKRNLLYSALGGFISWILLSAVRIYLRFDQVPLNLYGLSMPYFLAAAGVSLYSEVMAILRRTPVSIFLIVSLIPLVPGTHIFRSMVELIHGNYNTSIDSVIATLVIGGSVSLSVLFTSFMFQMLRRLRLLCIIKNRTHQP